MLDRQPRELGFSLVETLLAVSIGVVVAGSAVAWSMAAKDLLQSDANERVVVNALTYARELAINQRRDIEIQFVVPNTILVIRHELPAGTTPITSVVLEDNVQFQRFAALPDTPDAFGGTGALAFGNAAAMMFTADGMLTDPSGNPVNGSIFLARAGRSTTARAVTIFGATSRIRAYRWNGAAWGS